MSAGHHEPSTSSSSPSPTSAVPTTSRGLRLGGGGRTSLMETHSSVGLVVLPSARTRGLSSTLSCCSEFGETCLSSHELHDQAEPTSRRRHSRYVPATSRSVGSAISTYESARSFLTTSGLGVASQCRPAGSAAAAAAAAAELRGTAPWRRGQPTAGRVDAAAAPSQALQSPRGPAPARVARALGENSAASVASRPRLLLAARRCSPGHARIRPPPQQDAAAAPQRDARDLPSIDHRARPRPLVVLSPKRCYRLRYVSREAHGRLFRGAVVPEVRLSRRHHAPQAEKRVEVDALTLRGRAAVEVELHVEPLALGDELVDGHLASRLRDGHRAATAVAALALHGGLEATWLRVPRQGEEKIG
eukprot:6183293-Pleurochrysis_carterae.AAC.3